jgi:hypothetical protein
LIDKRLRGTGAGAIMPTLRHRLWKQRRHQWRIVFWLEPAASAPVLFSSSNLPNLNQPFAHSTQAV